MYKAKAIKKQNKTTIDASLSSTTPKAHGEIISTERHPSQFSEGPLSQATATLPLILKGYEFANQVFFFNGGIRTTFMGTH